MGLEVCSAGVVMSRLVSLLALLLSLVVVAPTAASTPATSTLTVPSSGGATVTATWTGTAPIGANPSSKCLIAGTPTSDDHALTVVVPAGTYDTVKATFTFKITWSPASGNVSNNDLILTVLDPSGLEVQSSDGGTPSEAITATNLAAGTYKVVVCGFVNTTAQPFSGSVTVTTASLGGGTTTANLLPGPGTKWNKPVKVTPTNGYGYEPTLIVDKYGNAFASAHKENWQLVLAPDQNSPTATRSMSWMWLSTDKGATWKNPPGLTEISLQQHEVGDEGDLAMDDAGHIYFVDTYLGDVTITRWRTDGLGSVTYEWNRPIVGTPELDDRPWITAHGDGHVFYFANHGRKDYNGGRYTVHASYDGGVTWDSVGVGLPDSGWCRPAADHRPGSKLVYAFCTNDGGKLYSYVSTDDGRSFTRYEVGKYNNADTTQSYPLLQVAPNGTLWALYIDSNNIGDGGLPVTNQIYLFKSTDQGKTFTKQEITPVVGRYQYAWLAMSNDGKKLGFGTYYRPNADYPWEFAAVSWATGDKPSATNFRSIDPDHPVAPVEADEPPGDYTGAYFFPDGKMGVVWTRRVLWTDVTTIQRDIYFARQR
jgi:hypothetical protein